MDGPGHASYTTNSNNGPEPGQKADAMRSITTTDQTSTWTTVPLWARYAVVYAPPLAYPATRPTVHQFFTSKPAAERWALACAKALPAGPVLERGFMLVYAFSGKPAGRRAFRSFQSECSVCYRAIDPGGRMAKDHPVPAGFGVAQSREYSHGLESARFVVTNKSHSVYYRPSKQNRNGWALCVVFHDDRAPEPWIVAHHTPPDDATPVSL